MLPDRSILIGQILKENAKIEISNCDIFQKFSNNFANKENKVANFSAKNRKVEKCKWDIFWDFQTLWLQSSCLEMDGHVQTQHKCQITDICQCHRKKREILNNRKCILERLREYRKIVPSVFWHFLGFYL